VFNSEILRSTAREYYPDMPDGTVVHNGVPLDEIESAETASHSNRFPEDRLTIASLGELIPRKNHEIVIRAIASMEPDSRPYYTIIGDGPNRDRLERLVAKKKIKPLVHFTGQVPEHQRVFSLLKAVDMMVLPSIDEAFGIAYIEAMSCGCPVIGCEGEGPSEFVEDGKTGFLIPENDPAEIARILAEISENRELIETMGTAARDYVRENLTWEENAKQMEEIFIQAGG
jgi:glycosyltransferase involved in cell wall biosynthesis